MCKRILFITTLLVWMLGCSRYAFASEVSSGGGDFYDRVIYGPVVTNVQSGEYGIQCFASNSFNAALVALGYDAYNPSFTADIKAYLSNQSDGGSFYEFSQLFTNNNSVEWGTNLYGITFSSALGTNNTLYGADSVYMAHYSSTLYDAAKQKVEEMLQNGGGSGGGNNEPEVPADSVTLTLNVATNGYTNRQSGNSGIAQGLNNVNYYLWSDDSSHSLAQPMRLTLTGQARNTMAAKIAQGYKYMFYAMRTFDLRDNQYTRRISYMLFKDVDDFRLDYGTVPRHGVIESMPSNFVITRGSNGKVYYGDFFVTRSINSLDMTYDGNIGSGDENTNNTIWISTAFVIDGPYSGDLPPSVPPTNWPEPTPTPTPEPPTVPDVPTDQPTMPPTEPSSPTVPIFTPPVLPTEPTYQTPDLSAVLDAMNEHCIHLQDAIAENFSEYYDDITTFESRFHTNLKDFLRGWFQEIQGTIESEISRLMRYLKLLFEWLADQMNFTFTDSSYDDSSVVAWLKRIYSKLGGGTNTRPTDPVSDPFGIGDWLDQLIKNFVLDLIALGQDFLADVVEMFRQLITKFPFSIPWDIGAILALFAAAPQTPVFRIPQYAVTGVGISQVGTYEMNLQPYNGVMEVARNVEKVIFAFWLCWKIDFFKAILDGIGIGGKS